MKCDMQDKHQLLTVKHRCVLNVKMNRSLGTYVIDSGIPMLHWNINMIKALTCLTCLEMPYHIIQLHVTVYWRGLTIRRLRHNFKDNIRLQFNVNTKHQHVYTVQNKHMSIGTVRIYVSVILCICRAGTYGCHPKCVYC